MRTRFAQLWYYEERDFPGREPKLCEAGAIRYAEAGPATLRLIDAAKAAEVLLPLLKEQPDLVLGPRANIASTP